MELFIFDVDGVIVGTAELNFKAWKQLFDEYLEKRYTMYEEEFKEFTKEDYLEYVDGKPRFRGVKSFLESRGIDLLYGDKEDSQTEETIRGLGNKKNLIYNELIAKEGVKVYDSTVDLIKEVKKRGIKLCAASSSKNARMVLESAGVIDFFDLLVDGITLTELDVEGKPKLRLFNYACEQLGVSIDKTVIIDDSISGIDAGYNGHFGLVIGVARHNKKKTLLKKGADKAVKDLSEITFDDIEKWFTEDLDEEGWKVDFFDYNDFEERKRESLLAVGNGYFGSRGSMEEFDAVGPHYPGTYMAGCFNRLKSEVEGMVVENEDFVNCPNWTFLSFSFGDDWFDLDKHQIKSLKRTLYFNNGVLEKQMSVVNEKGEKVRINSERVVSMKDPHLASIKYKVTPMNFSGKIMLKSSLDGTLINGGVERYKSLESKHLNPLVQEGDDDNMSLMVETNQSKIQIANSAKNLVEGYSKKEIVKKDGRVDLIYTFDVEEGKPIEIEKVVSICTSKDSNDPLKESKELLNKIDGFDKIQKESEEAWKKIWERIDVKIEGERFVQKLLRLHLYHLLVTASPHNKDLDVSIPARGLHGEAYRGHYFWDTLFILPFYNMTFPEVSKSALLYRYNRLDKARENAKESGFKGAMFPWQAGNSGDEETQIMHLNPVSGKWGEDNSRLQRHVSVGICYNVWRYFMQTNDVDFMKDFGAELFLDICKFWASKAEKDENGKYSIDKVMGPDEFHEKYPDAEEGGLKDNFYTNVMVCWAFSKIERILETIGTKKEEVMKKIGFSNEELDLCKDIQENINVWISEEGIFEQFKGFFDLEELDLEYYKIKYFNIQRMDRLLKAEGKSPDEYKIAKQADVLMTFYNLDQEEVKSILRNADYMTHEGFLERNTDYYLKRTSHGSTLSKIVHSYILNLIKDKELSYEYYMEALMSDYVDIQGGTTSEGIHTGVMAGTVMLAINSFAGVEVDDKIYIRPSLPKNWRKISFNMGFRKNQIQFEISEKQIKYKINGDGKINLVINENDIEAVPGNWNEIGIAGGM